MRTWNPDAVYAMLGEGTRRNMEDPVTRMASRKLMAPGFSREALRGYLHKVRQGLWEQRCVTNTCNCFVAPSPRSPYINILC